MSYPQMTICLWAEYSLVRMDYTDPPEAKHIPWRSIMEDGSLCDVVEASHARLLRHHRPRRPKINCSTLLDLETYVNLPTSAEDAQTRAALRQFVRERKARREARRTAKIMAAYEKEAEFVDSDPEDSRELLDFDADEYEEEEYAFGTMERYKTEAIRKREEDRRNRPTMLEPPSLAEWLGGLVGLPVMEWKKKRCKPGRNYEERLGSPFGRRVWRD